MANTPKISAINIKPNSTSTINYAGTSDSGSAGQKMPSVSTVEVK